jgi:putative ABC transport system substrate-binding protein
VIYPDIRPPYRDVFLDTIKGIEQVMAQPIKLYDLEKEYDSSDLISDLEKDQIRLVIALGRRGLRAATSLANQYPVVIGAVLVSSDTDGKRKLGISLTPDPDALFSQLTQLVPDTQRVSVVYDPTKNDWLMIHAKAAASRYGLELNLLPAKDLKQAAALYRKVIKAANSTQALWLPHDSSTVDKQAILTMILKEAWNKRFVVFSSNPAHVGKGALFSLYPDNRGMGRSLGELAKQRLLNDDETKGIDPAHDLLSAVNIRTAKRLGLKLTSKQQREFDLVFPSR